MLFLRQLTLAELWSISAWEEVLDWKIGHGKKLSVASKVIPLGKGDIAKS